MIDLSLFFKGILIGFSIAMPLGPIGLLCMQRTLLYGRLVGFFTGLGAATADAFYSSIAAFGLTFINNFLERFNLIIRLTGGIFLLFLGLKSLFVKNKVNGSASLKKTNLLGAFSSSFLLTLTNPVTILLFVGVFSGLNIETENCFSSNLLVGGVFIGSATWFLILTGTISLLRSKLSIFYLKLINIISGIIIICFALFILIKAIPIKINYFTF